ncbi:MAG TPA: UBP-type zinc finger domain-containing protein [Microbacterium sp.]|uniref:UBP-type zinc finger domain-containing protein n=1 Tax=Microbacterium sp. TaxID=51671 RepID=UPI002B490BC4|nr:UBP-type zinc finger domain-containing protein [Microbacterium sp.]HKT55319.1 UBP-type zinc finger domain-containing protein [Microbacterium sp.]
MADDVRDIPLSDVPPPSGTGCAECEAAGGWWFHLRRCVECGHVGCCDDSLERHARWHFEQTGHRFIRSLEPGEAWFWDFVTDKAVRGVPLPPPDHRPVEQTAPGPADRVPADWQEQLGRGR